ncbi:hypothetical protein BDW42DRAFT_181002 [Aspergillus taichungensis]|uniref:Uncharacterized protein n=1 Tax=Aspergillus taichungensis TaxID=482145 RepID=A0A2J5HEF8_9EURO|nr:hypothetical protein BDW42DRAFT_181002 [Aspergillus taichungensis]
MSDEHSPRLPLPEHTGSTTSDSSNPSHDLSRRGQVSSDESSTVSRIDSSDRWRFGGPGPLPQWPLVYDYHPGFEIPYHLSNSAIEIATQHARELPYSLIQVVCEHTEGEIPKREDLTLHIRGDLSNPLHTQWLNMLDTLIQVLLGMGWFGRIEVIDNRVTGIESFPPKLPQPAIASWESLVSGIIQQLETHQLPPVLVFPMNRGYWEDISVPTVIARVQKRNAPASTMNRVSKLLSDFVQDYGLQFELTGDDGLWGLFGTSGSQPLPGLAIESGTLGWPFNRGYNTMGMSVARKDVPDWSGTIGGYLTYNNRVLGITCHHVVRRGVHEQVDHDIDTTGGIDLPWVCQSPSTTDVETIETQLSGQIPPPMPSNIPTALIANRQRRAQETATKLEQVERYSVGLGNVVATSGWRNVPYKVQLGPEPPLEMIMDWAMVDMTPSHWTESANVIQDVAGDLAYDMNPVSSHWKCQDVIVPTVAKQINTGETLFKRGRSTGLTTGECIRVAPASLRILGIPQRLHHRCFIVAPYAGRKFAATGDSGSWCLNGKGEVVGILIGGDPTGSGLVIPMDLVIENMEAFLKLPSGSLKLLGSHQDEQV